MQEQEPSLHKSASARRGGTRQDSTGEDPRQAIGARHEDRMCPDPSETKRACRRRDWQVHANTSRIDPMPESQTRSAFDK
jgi:hypothetical protein